MAVSAQEMIDLYTEAETAVLFGKETQFNGRKAVMSDLPAIRAGRSEWEQKLKAEQRAARGGHGFSQAVFK